MIIKVIIFIVAFLIVRNVLAALLDWNSDEPSSFGEFFGDVKHNRAIDREWKRNGRPIVGTTVGYRPDPFNREDGFKENHPDGRAYFGDGKTYSKLIRGGTKEYREQFAKDVEKSRKE